MKRVGVLIAGFNGAVSSTLVAGVALLRRGLARPVALISEPFAKSHNLPRLNELVFAGWDPRGENLFESALRNRVLDRERLHPIARELSSLKPFGGRGSSRAVTRDLEAFRRHHKLETVLVLNLLPTGQNTASRVYAQAAAETGSPFINFTPNDCAESKLTGIPYCGRDGKTGQTWLKSVLAPALHARGFRIDGWYSTNLLGNEDGKVVGDPETGKQKIRDKTKLLGEMLGYEPHHQVQINYYPPCGDNKESWDHINFTGFLGQSMRLQIAAQYRDSLLAAPMCLDLVRFLTLAARQGARGPQTWLSLFFKAPYATTRHDFFHQEQMLRNHLRTNP